MSPAQLLAVSVWLTLIVALVTIGLVAIGLVDRASQRRRRGHHLERRR